jgi:methylglutaconyl-CoA hydratase
LGSDPQLRAIVLGGHGKAFCAGGDLNWMRAMADYSWDQNKADAGALAEMLWTIHSCPLPVVGRIHGDCYAGGVGLAAVCDVLVAADGMHFCLSEAKLGLLPATIGPYVIRALGEQASRRYFTTAERFSAARAHALGFVHEVVPPDAVDARVAEIVAALVANGPAAVKACKRWCRTWPAADRRRAARRHRAPHRRHPRQRRRARGRVGLPGQARPGLEDMTHARTRHHAPDRAGRGAGLGQRACGCMRWSSSPALAGYLGWVPLPAGPAGAAAPAGAGRQG